MEVPLPRRRFVRGIGAVLAGASLAGCSGDGGDGNTVDMTDNLVYDPDELTVSVGDTVTWENVGTVGHTVTAYEDRIPEGAAYFASGEYESEGAARDGYTSDQGGTLEAEETYEHTFETPGTYEYFCIPHESTMTGTIEVQEG